jgi:hypothetical protein
MNTKFVTMRSGLYRFHCIPGLHNFVIFTIGIATNNCYSYDVTHSFSKLVPGSAVICSHVLLVGRFYLLKNHIYGIFTILIKDEFDHFIYFWNRQTCASNNNFLSDIIIEYNGGLNSGTPFNSLEKFKIFF